MLILFYFVTCINGLDIVAKTALRMCQTEYAFLSEPAPTF